MTSVELLAAVDGLGWAPVGRSVDGRPIVAARFAADDDALAPLVVVAGVHGDEASSVEAVLAWVRDRGDVPLARPTWVVPVMNPDGTAAGRKNNARDVDLNRNFPARNWLPTGKPGYHPGAAAGSEPETQAFVALVDRVKPAAVLAVHAPFACVNYDGPALAWAETVAHACGWPVRADIGYPTPGSMGTWLGVERGVPTLTLELPAGPLSAFRAAALAALRSAVTHAAF